MTAVRRKRGFSLLEVVLSVGLFVSVVAVCGIYLPKAWVRLSQMPSIDEICAVQHAWRVHVQAKGLNAGPYYALCARTPQGTPPIQITESTVGDIDPCTLDLCVYQIHLEPCADTPHTFYVSLFTYSLMSRKARAEPVFRFPYRKYGEYLKGS